jgi:hypothetical protein
LDRYFAVVNWSKYQKGDVGKEWIRFQVDTFNDPLIFPLKPIEKLCWVAILCAAKKHKNRVKWDGRYVLAQAGLAGRIDLHLDTFASIGLIRELDSVVAEPEMPVAPTNASATEPQPKPKKDKKAKRQTEMERVNVPENREGVDDWNEILSSKHGYTQDNLDVFDRLRTAGYTRDDWRKVMIAYRDKLGSTAIWALSVGKIDWALRPGEKGGFAKILREQQPTKVLQFDPPKPKTPEEEDAEAERRHMERKALIG